MQPFHVVILLFSICLIYGIYRAIQDVREEAKQEALQVYYDAMREAIFKTTGLSESFLGLAKSTESANESIKRFSVILDVDSPGGMVKDSKEIHGFLRKSV